MCRYAADSSDRKNKFLLFVMQGVNGYYLLSVLDRIGVPIIISAVNYLGNSHCSDLGYVQTRGGL